MVVFFFVFWGVFYLISRKVNYFVYHVRIKALVCALYSINVKICFIYSYRSSWSYVAQEEKIIGLHSLFFLVFLFLILMFTRWHSLRSSVCSPPFPVCWSTFKIANKFSSFTSCVTDFLILLVIFVSHDFWPIKIPPSFHFNLRFIPTKDLRLKRQFFIY